MWQICVMQRQLSYTSMERLAQRLQYYYLHASHFINQRLSLLLSLRGNKGYDILV